MDGGPDLSRRDILGIAGGAAALATVDATPADAMRTQSIDDAILVEFNEARKRFIGAINWNEVRRNQEYMNLLRSLPLELERAVARLPTAHLGDTMPQGVVAAFEIFFEAFSAFFKVDQEKRTYFADMIALAEVCRQAGFDQRPLTAHSTLFIGEVLRTKLLDLVSPRAQ